MLKTRPWLRPGRPVTHSEVGRGVPSLADGARSCRLRLSFGGRRAV